VHHLAAALPGLPPGEAPGYLSHQVRQQRGPGLIGYRGSSDCRVLVVSHKPIMIAAAAPLRGPLTCASNPTVTNYSCRINSGVVADVPIPAGAFIAAGGRLLIRPDHVYDTSCVPLCRRQERMEEAVQAR